MNYDKPPMGTKVRMLVIPPDRGKTEWRARLAGIEGEVIDTYELNKYEFFGVKWDIEDDDDFDEDDIDAFMYWDVYPWDVEIIDEKEPKFITDPNYENLFE